MIDKNLYDDLLNKKYPDVIADFDRDDKEGIMELEDWEGLKKHEETHNKRKQLLDYFTIKIKQFKKSDSPESIKKERRNKKMSDEKGLNIVLKPECKHTAISIPKFGGITLSKKRPVRVTKAMLDYVKERYAETDYQIMSDTEIAKRDKEIAKAKEEAKEK